MKRRVTRRGAGAAIALVASLLVLAPVRGRARGIDVGGRTGGHLTPRSTMRDLLGHRAFAGFGELLLPWDDRAYDEHMLLTDIGSLLPYHSHVDPETVTSALNPQNSVGHFTAPGCATRFGRTARPVEHR